MSSVEFQGSSQEETVNPGALKQENASPPTGSITNFDNEKYETRRIRREIFAFVHGDDDDGDENAENGEKVVRISGGRGASSKWTTLPNTIASPPYSGVEGHISFAHTEIVDSRFVVPNGWGPLDVLRELAENPAIVAEKDAKRRLALLSFATYEGGEEQFVDKPDWKTGGVRRIRKNARAATAVVLEWDDGSVTVEIVAAKLRENNLQGLVYTTHSNTLEKPRVRAIIAIRRPFDLTGDGWDDFRARVLEFARSLGAGTVDPSCADPTRLHYTPAKRSEDAPYEYQFVPGEPLDLEAIVVPQPIAQPKPAPRTVAHVPAELHDVEAALKCIDPCGGRDEWRNVIYAVHSEFAGTDNEDDARTLCESWSQGCPDKFVQEAFDDLWDGADLNGKIKIGTLFHIAKKYGYTKSIAVDRADDGEHTDPATADLRATAAECLKLDDVEGTAKEAATSKIVPHLDKNTAKEFEARCADFASRQKLSETVAVSVIEREVFRQVLPPEVRKYADRYARITVGGKPMIVDMDRPSHGNALMHDSDFLKANDRDYRVYIVPTATGQKEIRVNFAAQFLKQHVAAMRHFPDGFDFNPKVVGNTLDAQSLNLFKGMQVKPSPEGSCELLEQLIREVWCGGDEDLFKWVWEFLLHIVARPWERPDTGLAINGEPGAGKSLPFEMCLKDILGDQLLIVEDEQTVLGPFTSSIKGKIGIVLEEAAFAGNPQLFDKLKQRVTGHKVHINEKHKPAYDIDNYARIIVISNHDHFMHVKPGDRRYTVLTASQADAERWKSEGLYEKLVEQWKNGGAERFVWEALNHEFRTVEGGKRLVIQTSYKTQALGGQIGDSRSALERVLVEALLTGRSLVGWHDTRVTEIAALELHKRVVEQVARQPGYDARKLPSLKAVTAAFERMGIQTKGIRKSDGTTKATVRVLPPRAEALKAALAKQAITQDEFDAAGATGKSTAQAAIEALKASVEPTSFCKIERTYAEAAGQGRAELARLPIDIAELELKLMKARQPHERTRIEADLEAANRRLIELPREIASAAGKQEEHQSEWMSATCAADDLEVDDWVAASCAE